MAYHVVFIPAKEVDRRGVHVANIEGMRRAVAGLPVRPGYVLSDGFRVPGLPMPSLPVVAQPNSVVTNIRQKYYKKLIL